MGRLVAVALVVVGWAARWRVAVAVVVVGRARRRRVAIALVVVGRTRRRLEAVVVLLAGRTRRLLVAVAVLVAGWARQRLVAVALVVGRWAGRWRVAVAVVVAGRAQWRRVAMAVVVYGWGERLPTRQPTQLGAVVRPRQREGVPPSRRTRGEERRGAWSREGIAARRGMMRGCCCVLVGSSIQLPHPVRRRSRRPRARARPMAHRVTRASARKQLPVAAAAALFAPPPGVPFPLASHGGVDGGCRAGASAGG